MTLYGWSAKGERIHGFKADCRQGRINMIAGYRYGQMITRFALPIDHRTNSLHSRNVSKI